MIENAEGFGNYVYVLFVIAYIIYSVIKGAKKVSANRPQTRKPDPSAPSPSTPPPTAAPVPTQEDEVKKMLEEIFGGVPEIRKPKRTPAPPAAPQPKPGHQTAKQARKPLRPAAVRPTPEKSRAKPLVKEAHVQTTETKFVSHPEVLQSITIPEPEPEETRPEFDLRQAILYSEILRRPAY